MKRPLEELNGKEPSYRKKDKVIKNISGDNVNS
jgi:hypothetical protein